MPERKSHAPGTFCFPEAASGDLKSAKAFYGDLLGWHVRDVTGGFYSLAERKGKPVAGLYGITPDQRAKGVSPHWMSYVRVASTDASAEKATALGGKVLAPAFDVPAVGRMAVVEDPTGACFALWEPKGHEGSGVVDEPGAPCWYELMTPDPARAEAFYAGLFGWTGADSEKAVVAGYRAFNLGNEMVSGMLPTPAELRGKVPAHWLPYFAVEDCDSVAKECGRLGGRTVHPPTDMPGGGRFAVLCAPDGATFGVVKLWY
jgi:predicted enzyme related to lactoylglutathione lyase